jgi:hypothetical protein
MGQEEEAPTTVKAWVDHTSASYWWIDADANSITYVTGQKFQLPDELLKLGIENCEIGDGLDVFNATVGCGCLKMKCAEVSDVKSLDLPYWKKEVPVATASPPGTCASSSTPSEPVLWGNNSSEVVQGLGWF